MRTKDVDEMNEEGTLQTFHLPPCSSNERTLSSRQNKEILLTYKLYSPAAVPLSMTYCYKSLKHSLDVKLINFYIYIPQESILHCIFD